MPSRRAGPVATAEQPARLPREQRREHLLDVTAELIAEIGIDGITMEGVAARAGVSKGLGYAYFDNRGDLVAALFARELGELDRRVGEAVAAEPTFEGKVRATLEVWFDTVAERGPLIATLLQPTLDGPVERRRRGRLRSVRDFWAGLAEHDLGIPHRQATVAAAILLTGSTGALELWIAGEAPRQEVVDTFVTMSVAALVALAPAGTAAP